MYFWKRFRSSPTSSRLQNWKSKKIRGVKSDHAVSKLVEYDLVEEVGRMDAPGKPLLFGTTEEFLRRFSVHSLDELPAPNPEQVAHFKEEAEDEVQLKVKPVVLIKNLRT